MIGQRLTAQRLGAQLLAGRRSTDVISVVDRLLAVQAQDARGARLAIRARSRGLTAADVDRCLTVDRSLVVSWLNRGTLHLVRSEDYWWLHELTTPQLTTGNAYRLRQEGGSTADADRGVTVIERALAEVGPMTRVQLRERVAASGVRTQGQALIHLLLLASIRGLVIRGPMIGGEQAFVLVRDWLGDRPPPLDRDEALGRLARRYLAGHGPAGAPDLARWAGIRLSDARRGFAIVEDEVDTSDDNVMLRGAPSARLPAPRLLGPFDPLLLGWASRRFVLGTDAGVVTSNGIFHPVALVRGRVVATWTMPDGVARLRPLEPIDALTERALERDAADVRRYLGLGLVGTPPCWDPALSGDGFACRVTETSGISRATCSL